jgi:hypothetical protein
MRLWKDMRRRTHLPTASFIRRSLMIPEWPASSLEGPGKMIGDLLRGRLPDTGVAAARMIGIAIVGPPRCPKGITMSSEYLRRKDAEYHRAEYWRDPERGRAQSRAKYRRKRARTLARQAQAALLATGSTSAHPALVQQIAEDVLRALSQHMASRQKEESARQVRLLAQEAEARERFFRDM